jgi:hypothetical protein
MRFLVCAAAILFAGGGVASADWDYEEADYGPEAFVSAAGYSLVLGCYYVSELPEEFLILYVPGTHTSADADRFNARDAELTVAINGKDHVFSAPSRVAEDGTLFFEASLENIGDAYTAFINALKSASGSVDVRVTLKSPDETYAQPTFPSTGSGVAVGKYFAECI